MKRTSKQKVFGLPLLMISVACLFAACAGKGCDSIFPEQASKYRVSRVETEGKPTINIKFQLDKTGYEDYLESIPLNDYFTFAVRVVQSGEKISASCSHTRVGDLFEGNCVAHDDVFADAQKIYVVADRKAFTADQAETEATRVAKTMMTCLNNGRCPKPEEVEDEYNDMIWNGEDACPDFLENPEGQQEAANPAAEAMRRKILAACNGIKAIGCLGLSKEACFGWNEDVLEYRLLASRESYKTPVLSLEGIKAISTDCALGSENPACAVTEEGTEEESEEEVADSGDTTLPADTDDTVAATGNLDSGDGGCTLAGTAAVNPVLFILLGAALLPIVRRRRK